MTHTHAFKGAVGVCAAALCLAWPPAVSWFAAVCLLYWGVDHLNAAFKALDPEITHDAPERGRLDDGDRHLPARTRP